MGTQTEIPVEKIEVVATEVKGKVSPVTRKTLQAFAEQAMRMKIEELLSAEEYEEMQEMIKRVQENWIKKMFK